jgi:hypothetical protein
MKSIGTTILITLALFMTSPAAAAGYSDLYIIPAAGHSHGAYGTLWRSDLVLHNIQQVPITVEIAIVESGRAPSAAPIAVNAGAETAFHLNPGETRVLSDVAGHLGRDITGALIVGADMPFAVTSRAWAELPGGRTLGQTVRPIAIAGAADAVNETAVPPLAGAQRAAALEHRRVRRRVARPSGRRDHPAVRGGRNARIGARGAR